MKICTKCGHLKHITEFAKDVQKRDLLSSKCRSCFHDYYQSNLSEIRAAQDIYRLANKDLVMASTARWRLANRKRTNELNRLSYHRRKAHVSVRARISRNMKNRLYIALRRKKHGLPWEGILGYSARDLMSHLESLFANGMTWANYGKWEIDHIRPIASFKFTSIRDTDFKECWALKNLQPLWAADNRRKARSADIALDA